MLKLSFDREISYRISVYNVSFTKSIRQVYSASRYAQASHFAHVVLMLI